MCPDRKFSSKIYQNVIFSGKIGKSKKIRKSFQFSNFCEIDRFVVSKYTSCSNFVKNIDFWGSYIIFRFYRFTRTLTRIYGNRTGYLSEKSCNFWSKEARAFKFGHLMRNMMHLKVTNYWDSRKIFSMCKIENAAGGAKLHPPPQDRVNADDIRVDVVRYCQPYLDFEKPNPTELWHKALLLWKDKPKWCGIALVIEICLCTRCSNSKLRRPFNQLKGASDGVSRDAG